MLGPASGGGRSSPPSRRPRSGSPSQASPAPPGPGASSYQQSQYQNALAHWRARGRRRAARGRRPDQGRPRGAGSRSLRLPLTGTGPADQRAASLPAECSLAASTGHGPGEPGWLAFPRPGRAAVRREPQRHAPRRANWTGTTSSPSPRTVPSAAAASAAQLDLLAAGASFAAVLGPEATPAQLDHLVSGALSGHVISEVVSGQALFGNDSAALRPAAARVLAPLAVRASPPGRQRRRERLRLQPGSSQHNQVLSQARASAVCRVPGGQGRRPIIAAGRRARGQ